MDETPDEKRRRSARERARRYYARNKENPQFMEMHRARNSAAHAKHRDERLTKRRNASQQEREKRRLVGRRWAEKNREKKRAADKTWKAANPDAWKLWFAKNRAHRAEYQRQRQGRLRLESIDYRLAHSLRSRIGLAVRGKIKGGSAVTALGCTLDEFRTHIEGQFQKGMTWENWSRKGWHLDHIRPLASFDLSAPEQFAAAAHFTNYQPLWAIENCKKGSRWAHEIRP